MASWVPLSRSRRVFNPSAAGRDVLRLGGWFLETARANTRITPFARLMADASVA
jgi:hypothetical protein